MPALTEPLTALYGSSVPVVIERDRSLRLKVIDACGLACTFCHNEGTPVVADNARRAPGAFVPDGPSGRVSIYLSSNGARFLPAPIQPDAELADVLNRLRVALDLDELHLTGGEPTLHPRIAEIVRIGRVAGLTVGITSNGERGSAVLADCASAGLDRINFSIFGTTAEELAAVQHPKLANISRAERKLAALHDAIEAAEQAGVRASANIVVPDERHVRRVHRLLDRFSPTLSVRLLNSLADGQRSIAAVGRVLAERGAVPTAHHVTAGVSGWRTAYALPDGRTVWFKQIRPVRLPETCAGCRFNNDRDCEEGFYGVRLYRDRSGTFQVGVCIQRMDLCLPVDEFVGSDLCREVIDFRDREYRQLTA